MWRRFVYLFFSALFTLFVISILTFGLMKAVPGGPFDADRSFAPEILQSLQQRFGLDRPWPVQYFSYLRGLVWEGDAGPSLKYLGRSVSDILGESIPVSLELGIYALAIAIVSGVLWGCLAAVFHQRFFDFFATLMAIAGISLPSFLVAALAILFFSQTWGLFPAALWDSPLHKVLPSLVLGLRPAALLARLVRSSVLEVLPLDYVRTARAKGLGPVRVVLTHVLRNALVPVLTALGPMAANILSGSFVIEYIFSIPGLASEFIQAITNRDYPVIMGATLFYAALLIGLHLLIDIAYGIFDPRMREPI